MLVINLTATGFLIVGFSDFPHGQVPLFASFLFIYLITLTGNLVVFVTIFNNLHLHTPMYFFIANLSWVDIIYTSISFPQMLANFFQGKTPISFTACLLQSYFLMSMMCVEFILLTAMSFDRYVAICNPLRYTVVMSKSMFLQLLACAWIGGFLDPIAHAVPTSRLSFCSSHEINHFICDISAILKLSCSSTLSIEFISYVVAVTEILGMLILTFTSYVYIISAIMKIRSSKGRRKTFSTCASHLTVVLLYYGAICTVYVRPSSTSSLNDTKIYSFVYIAAVPLCNPFIYSLKNKELKNSLIRRSHKRV